MLRERSCFNRAIVFEVCILFSVVLAEAGAPGGRYPSGFTLALNAGDDPSPILFTLASPAPEPGGLAGPGGLGVIEDSDWPYRTALGFMALENTTAGEGNTAFGYETLRYADFNTSYDTAVGFRALLRTVGASNTAIGARALTTNTGSSNTAVGIDALMYNDGCGNTAIGSGALIDNYYGFDNTAIGASSLNSNAHGDGNTAVGSGALRNLGVTMSFNTVLGFKAGSSFSSPDNYFPGNYNIFIGANQGGMIGDSNTIRIGLPYGSVVPGSTSEAVGQNKAYIAGIVESQLSLSDGPSVVGITSEGRLGTMSTDMLPQGPQGPQGIPGTQGPPGEGLLPGSLLYMAAGFEPPAGYMLLGMTEIGVIDPVAKKATRLKVNIYQKL